MKIYEKIRSVFKEVKIPVDNNNIYAELVVPSDVKGIVIIAYGSSRDRYNQRNQLVARKLQNQNIATLQLDLLTAEEDKNFLNRFDTQSLAERLIDATDWVTHDSNCEGLEISYYGIGTGAAAAIIAATLDGGESIKSIVAIAGRVDLAGKSIKELTTPIMLIVGQNDKAILGMNEEVFINLNCTKKIAIIPNTNHLFEEPGAMDKVSDLTTEWLNESLEAE